jgi:glycosyltransferase involved in cell wall biosynthesis
MKILLLTKYGRRGATSRIRFLQYIPYLKEHGHDIQIAPFLEDDYIDSLFSGRRSWRAVVGGFARRFGQILSAKQYDLIWLEKELLPWMPSALERLPVPYVVDYDDATFHAYDLHPNALVRSILGKKIRTVMRRARTVVAGNDYLAEYARQSGASDIQIIPTVVDLQKYQLHDAQHDDKFTIGWIGSPWTARYLPAMNPVFKQLCRSGNVRIVLIGAGKVNLGGIPVEIREWREATEVDEIQRIDVGIMPLSDEPFERGKCGYKLIQYMACGKPVVASAVGANRSIVDDGRTGFLVHSTEEWIRALEEMKNNPARRSEMGKAARLDVEAQYSLQVQAPRILKILERALEG